MTENNQINIQEVLAQYKKIEAQLKASMPKEEFKKLVKPSKGKKVEKSEDFNIIKDKFWKMIKEFEPVINKVFQSSITSEKPKGQKWIIFTLGGKYSGAILNNEIKSAKKE